MDAPRALGALIGWPLLAVPDAHGALHYPGLDRSVRDSLRVILATRPGEQLMRPDFGAGLERLLHEPNNLTTRKRLQDLVRDSIARWERRIVLDSVEVAEVAGEPTWLRVVIAYRLLRTGQPASLSMTLQLEG